MKIKPMFEINTFDELVRLFEINSNTEAQVNKVMEITLNAIGIDTTPIKPESMRLRNFYKLWSDIPANKGTAC